MHELGISQDLIDTVLEYARSADARQVERVVLRVGAQAGVDPEAIRFACQVLARGTIAENAVIELEGDSAEAGQRVERIADHALTVVAIEVA